MTPEEQAKLDKHIASLTPEQHAALAQAVLVQGAREDSVQGVACLFRLMHGTNLHREGFKWIRNAYADHAAGHGTAQESHRESGKTTVFSKYLMAFRIGHEPWKVNGIIRINDTKAQETAAAVAYLIEFDPRWKLIFPTVVPDKLRGWGAETGYYVRDTSYSDEEWTKKCDGRPDGPTFIGRGWRNGAIIGSRYNGLLIVDDIHDEENTSSGRQLQAVKKFYTDTLVYCRMKGCWEVWNFTPWVDNDVYAFIKQTGEYGLHQTPVMRPAVEGEAGAQYWPSTPLNPQFPDAGNIPLSNRWWHLYWPEVWGFERISSVYRTSTPMGFARMMLLDLTATKGLNLRREWLHEYPALDIRPSWPTFMGVDYASTADKLRNKERDFFALAIMRAIPGGGLVLIDGYKAHLSKGEALDAVFSYWSTYPTMQRIGVENIGKGEEFYNDLLLMNDNGGRVPPLMAIHHGRRSKGDRFENWLAPRFSAARIWMTDTYTPFVSSFMEEWLSYPNGAHDDAIDAVYMCALAGEGFLPVTNTERQFGRGPVRRNPWLSLSRT